MAATREEAPAPLRAPDQNKRFGDPDSGYIIRRMIPELQANHSTAAAGSDE
jgi:hypothetical protein